ncbi:MAG: sulfotransferase [Paracoccaceae bacterium]
MKGAKKKPSILGFSILAGSALGNSGRNKEAAIQFQKVYKDRSDDHKAQDNLILSLIQSGQYQLAQVLIDRHSEARASSAEFQHLRALHAFKNHWYQKAVDACDHALSMRSKWPEVKLMQAKAHARMQKSDAAISLLNSILEEFPNDVLARWEHAKILASQGRNSQAFEEILRVLDQDSTHTAAIFTAAYMPNLSDTQRTEIDKRIRVADHALPDANNKLRFPLEFARYLQATSKSQDDRALDLLSSAKSKEAKLRPFKSQTADKTLRQTLAMTSIPATSTPDNQTPRPIIITGLPRSGTTLIERTISAHSDVIGCGEMRAAGRWANGSNITETVDGLAAQYRAELPKTKPEIRAFVDKMPANYKFLGQISAAFPDASLILVERDPRDVALSMWRTHFSAAGMRYTLDQKWMAEEVNRFKKYTIHWRKLLGPRLHVVRYETLVQNFEFEAKTLADACGLSWQEAMLHPENATDSVTTASLHQVRQSVNDKSVGRWRENRQLLARFCDNLDKKLWPDLSET